jgi:hypothetical protein
MTAFRLDLIEHDFMDGRQVPVIACEIQSVADQKATLKGHSHIIKGDFDRAAFKFIYKSTYLYGFRAQLRDMIEQPVESDTRIYDVLDDQYVASLQSKLNIFCYPDASAALRLIAIAGQPHEINPYGEIKTSCEIRHKNKCTVEYTYQDEFPALIVAVDSLGQTRYTPADLLR